jgi:hypothetical protein
MIKTQPQPQLEAATQVETETETEIKIETNNIETNNIETNNIESKPHKSKEFKKNRICIAETKLNKVSELYYLQNPYNFTSARIHKKKFLTNIYALSDSKFDCIKLLINLITHIYIYPFMKYYLFIYLFLSRIYEFTYPTLINTPFTDYNISSVIFSNYITNNFYIKPQLIHNNPNTINNANANLNTNIIQQSNIKQIQQLIQLSLKDIQIVFDTYNFSYSNTDLHNKPIIPITSITPNTPNKTNTPIKTIKPQINNKKKVKSKTIKQAKQAKHHEIQIESGINLCSSLNINTPNIVYEDENVRVYYINGKRNIDYSSKFIKSYLQKYPEDFELVQSKFPNQDLSYLIE